jgi:fatty acid desaturase
MADAVVSWIEAAVGVACLIASAGAWRRPGLWLVAVVLAVAGVVAVVHAAIALT